LVNGLSTLSRWPVLLIALFRKDALIYLHETGYILDQFQKHRPFRYLLAAKILKRNPVLCVSKQAQAHYCTRFSSTRTHVVYECPGNIDPPVLDPQKIHIVMVGSINERKGAELFSRVADLAADSYPNFRFHWVGTMATLSKLYQSSNVTWHGWQWNPSAIVRQCNIFFLSSIDDPCPLAALEALHMGKGCIAFQETGTAELIRGVRCCSVFVEYSATSALSSLVEVASSITSVNKSDLFSSLLMQTTPEYYVQNFLKIFSHDFPDPPHRSGGAIQKPR